LQLCYARTAVATETVRAPLVGRAVELERVAAFLDAVSQGPNALFLEGTPGIGKTRLWTEAIRLTRLRGFYVAATRPAETDAELAFAGIGDLLRDRLDHLLGDLPPPQRRALRTALLLEDAESSRPDRHLVGASVLGALRALSRAEPVVVAVDDAQWLDAVSADALAFAFRRVTGEQVGLLATVRIGTESRRTDALVTAVREDRRVRHRVGPLSVAGVYELIRTTLAMQLARPVLARVHEVSAGNPFFALELARALGERRATVAPGEPLPVPPRLHDLLFERLRELPADTRELLLVVAALARPTLAILREVAGPRVDEDLDSALAAGVVELDGEAIRFTHPLLSSVHYSTAARRARRRIHGRLAASNLTDEERARHLAFASDPPDELVASTLDAAAHSARARGAIATGAELAERAVAFTAPDSPLRAERVRLGAELLHAAGDPGRARTLLEGELPRHQAGDARAQLLLTLGRLFADAVDVRDALETLKAARDTATLPRARAEALTAIAGIAGPLEGYESAVRYAEEAVSAAESSGEPMLLSRALTRLADRSYMIDGEVRRGLMQRAMALANEAEPKGRDLEAATSYASMLSDAEEYGAARQVLERLCEDAGEAEDAALSAPLCGLAQLEFWTGHIERGRALAREALALAEQTGRVASEGEAHWILAFVEGIAGDVAAARAHGERAYELFDAAGLGLRGPRMALGMLEVSLANHEAAWRYFDPSLERNATEGMGRLRYQVPAAAEALARLGRVDEARALLRPWAARAKRLKRRGALALAARCNGLIAAAEGELERAEAHLVESVDHAGASAVPLELGRGLLVLGEIQRRRQKKAAARETLERALVVFEEIGAPLWADLARRETARIGGRRSPARGGLSQTERRIVELVATGHTNLEIARLLSLSPKTVEWNLSKIYRKLGVRSRTELAATR
jgi:DNA-binding CsgD family transcriptional regulator